jgi:hypothetical protein
MIVSFTGHRPLFKSFIAGLTPYAAAMVMLTVNTTSVKRPGENFFAGAAKTERSGRC